MNTTSSRCGLLVVVACVALLSAGCEHPGGESTTAAVSAAAPASGPATRELQVATTPQQALARLREGNARFVSGHPLHRDLLAEVKATSSGQYPYAVVLSCVDSRQPSEVVLDQGIGDIFNGRVAGNVVDDDMLGSLEFACKVAGAKLIAVIGHTSCGAVKGAIGGVELDHLTGLLARIKPAIDRVPSDVQPRDAHNAKFVDQVAEANVRLVMEQIPQRSAILRELLEQKQIGLVGGLYDISTGEVRFFGE